MPDVVSTIAFVIFFTAFQCAVMLGFLYVFHFRPEAKPEPSNVVQRWSNRLLQSHRLLGTVLFVVVALAIGLGVTAILPLIGLSPDWITSISVTLGTALGLVLYTVWWRPHGTAED